MTHSVSEYLLHGHHELSQLLNKLSEELKSVPVSLDAAQTFSRLERSCRKVSQALHAHLQKEEQVLYPALEAHVEGVTITIERMRRERNAGEAVEKAFFDCLRRAGKAGLSREEIVESGRTYVQWVRSHLLNENGRLLPLVERRLDAETQKVVRCAMEELSHETSARIAESFPHGEES